MLGSLIRASNECLKSRDVVICAIFETAACCEFDMVPRSQLGGGGWPHRWVSRGGNNISKIFRIKWENSQGAVSGCYAAVEGVSQGTALEVQGLDGKRHLLDREPPAQVRTGGGTR